MQVPFEQLIIGIFALFGAAVTGAFSIYNTKISRKLAKVEKKTVGNHTLTVGNDILEEIIPALERKDEALDKIADILDNILEVQKLQNTRLTALQLLIKDVTQIIRDFCDKESIKKGGESID